MSKIKHIIIQAGGKGTRMLSMTNNKPKALISVRGIPIILRTMSRFPGSRFYIVVQYKKDVIAEYLKLYSKEDYILVPAEKSGTNSGIREALSLIPDNNPVLILWSDLYFEKSVLPARVSARRYNYLGLSTTFFCRWKFEKKLLVEERSNSKGVAGVYLFKNKREISDIPLSGEFCKYLQQKNIQFRSFALKNVQEIGTIEAYKNYISSFPVTRPFNSILFSDKTVTKMPVSFQGKELAKNERDWYKFISKYKWNFIPKVKKYQPLVLEKVNGDNLFKFNLNESTKSIVLKRLVENLKTIHQEKTNISFETYNNDRFAILVKTKQRLDSVKSLIPHIEKDYIVINGKKCLNFYKKWAFTEKYFNFFLVDNQYTLIHGDPTFSNTLYDKMRDKIWLIDPRGYYGSVKYFGDPDYDWSKIYYSIIGNYDQFNLKKFILKIDSKGADLSIESNGWEKQEKLFFKLINRNIYKIKFFHAIIWLSLSTYAWDDYDSICGAFYNGIYLMQELYETSHRKAN